MNTTMATDFLTRYFRPEDTIAVLLRREDPSGIAQRIVRMEQAIAPAYMRWLSHGNAGGMNIYVAANPLRAGSRKRTKECVAEIRHLYLDIDCDGDVRLAALRASGAVPEPSAILATSPNKYQVLWSVKGFDLPTQELTLKQLVITFGGDAACTDCNRVLRIPGFRNAKYTPPHLVTVEYLSGVTTTSEDFRLSDSSPEANFSVRDSARIPTSGKHTHSEQDWVWVLAELSRGSGAEQLTAALAARRCDKPNPAYYARRTVDMASARLALLAGAAMDDVITTLEKRRSAELPTALCSARAREITQTAAHRIAHGKLA